MIRVRFAPSPTGYLHVGGARTALFNWLYARKAGGAFLLRIEDTDLQRSTDESTRSIFEGLEWLGLRSDEPVVLQGANAEKHRAAALKLLEAGTAYRDFTPKQERGPKDSPGDVKARVAARARAQDAAGLRDNPYRDLPRADSDRRAAAGEPFALRLKVPEEGRTRFEDTIYGTVERDYAEIEDMVILRSDGSPLYNLSVVLDDIEMRISDVIRGQDHLTNTHKQILLYEALGAPVPRFAHVPLILAPDRSKLSKRKHGAVASVTTYRDRGFLPAAFRNFLALLGWSPGNDQEILSLDEMIDRFSLEAISRAPAVFNYSESDPRAWTDKKALWMNAAYLRAMPIVDLLPLVRGELERAGLWRAEFEGAEQERFRRAVDLVRERFFTLEDFGRLGRAYFAEEFPFDEAAVQKNLAKEPRLKDLLPALAERLEKVEPFTGETAEAALRAFAAEQEVKDGLLINAARTALTGQAVGPSMFAIFDLLGRTRSAERMRRAARLVRAGS